MHILMIAPEPFFEPRGTPFSEFHRIKALIALGHTVDLVTYPFGRDVEMPGLTVFRCLRPPFVQHVRIGPSWAKVPLDAALAATALRRALATSYDAVHSHEEGGLIGVVLSAMLGVPHLYDMHSSLPQQLSNFDVSSSKPLVWGMGLVERLLVRRSRVVIVICQQLVEVVRAIDPLVPTVLIENAPGSGDLPVAGASPSLRAAWGIAPDVPVVLYTGTFEAYQGLDLLYAAAARVRATRPDVRFLVVGGQPDQVEAARIQAKSAGADGVVVFTGQRPSEEIPQFLDAATVLASPRSRGTNTPLKIYQYLRAGRPIIATRLLTHTQVLDDSVAVLTEATPDAYAAGILRAVDDPVEADAIGRRARALADTKYSYEAYLERTRHAYAELFGSGAAQVARGVA
jgi:glycosyltransferase involved in cell wall biosynthesis